METLTAKLEGTGRHLLEESEAFLARTRLAGAAFVTETGRAGTVLARAARSEARGWARYLRTRTPTLVRPRMPSTVGPALERRVLRRVDAAVTAVGERVRARLGELPAEPRLPAATRRSPAKAPARRPRRARPARRTTAS